MEATTAATGRPTTGSKTIADLLAAGREAVRRSPGAAPQARRRVARRQLRRGRRGRVGDRPRPDRPRRRARRARLHPLPTRAPSGRTATSRSPRRARPSSRSTRRTRRRSASGSPGNSEARAVVCEDAAQVAKIVAVRERLPDLRTIVVIDPAGDVADAVSLDEVRERGRGVEDVASSRQRAAAVTPEDPFTFIYTSGTTGPPKGCVLSHGNYRDVLDMCETIDVVRGRRVRLPVPPARPRLRAADPAADASTSAARSRTSAATRSRSSPSWRRSSRPTSRRCRASSRSSTRSPRPASSRRLRGAVRRDGRARRQGPRPRRPAASRSRRSCQKPFDAGRRAGVRERARSSAAACARPSPAPRRSRRRSSSSSTPPACPVLEGYGMTETATVATYSTLEDHKFGTVGARCRASRSGSPRTARC